MGSPSDTVAVAEAAEVLAALGARPATLGRGRLLCLDGPAGSGKSTLAAAVAALTRATVVHLDDLYAGWSGLDDLATRLEPLLRPLAEDASGRYRRWDWRLGRFAETVAVAPCDLLVLDGVGSGLSAYAALRTLLVWVEVPRELRTARWRARDGADAEPFIAAWQRREDALFARERTRETADVVWRPVR